MPVIVSIPITRFESEPPIMQTATKIRPCDVIDADALIEALPHGSGIDAQWTIDELKNGNLVASCAFHGMDEHGYYDGWQEFKVTIFPQQPSGIIIVGDGVHKPDMFAIRVNFTGYRQSSSKSWMCGLKDYLWETIEYSLSESGILKG